MYLTIVKMDRQGRILIPADIRAKLSEFFDSIEVDVDDFTDTHKLRKALLEGGSP